MFYLTFNEDDPTNPDQPDDNHQNKKPVELEGKDLARQEFKDQQAALKDPKHEFSLSRNDKIKYFLFAFSCAQVVLYYMGKLSILFF
jgi:hypothetical protein